MNQRTIRCFAALVVALLKQLPVVALSAALLATGAETVSAGQRGPLFERGHPGTVASIREDLDETLAALYFATGGPDWLNNTGWLTDAPLDTWYGVEAMPDGSDVRSLSLQDNQLNGLLPSELGQLRRLAILALYDNQLSGPIPPELGQLRRLEILSLNDNQLSGPIPPELGRVGRDVQGTPGLRSSGARLITRYVDLSGNQLSGPIPPELGQLSGFQDVRLNHNRLSGPIPPGLSQMDVRTLRLHNNQLSGPIPPRLSQFRGESLQLSHNHLTGPIPPELERFRGTLYVDHNQLTGPLPSELGRFDGRLDLVGNQLSGPIPLELGQSTGHFSLDGDTGLCLPPEIRDTAFGEMVTSGPLRVINGEWKTFNNVPLCTAPPEGATVDALRAFYFATGGPDWRNANNWLSTSPLATWFGVTATDDGVDVRSLALPGNGLRGSIPLELTQLDVLEHLNLSGNQLSGLIPPELGQLGRLRYGTSELGRISRSFNLSGNQLSGPIPPELGQLSGVENLNLFGNRLSGPIPPELGEMGMLGSLNLGSNQLSGPIPPELGRLTGLKSLRIDNDTGLCLAPQLQHTVFGRLAIDDNGVPLCSAVPTLPVLATWALAFAVVVRTWCAGSSRPVVTREPSCRPRRRSSGSAPTRWWTRSAGSKRASPSGSRRTR